KFVPNQAASITFDDGFHVNVRLVDCVGYVISEAKGYRDEDGERMIRTPWLEEAIPFHEAAKIGTQKVIQDHSTIGIVITTDGSIVDLSREAYVDAENEAIEELKAIGKPFIIIVNSKQPQGAIAEGIVNKLKDKHGVPVLALACNQLKEEDVLAILKEALYEFPISEVKMNIPRWIMVLKEEHWLKSSIQNSIKSSMKSVNKLRELENIVQVLMENEYIHHANMNNLDPGKGNVEVEIDVENQWYHQIMKEIIGMDLNDKADLLSFMQDVTIAKKEYDALSSALKMVKQTGYGFANCALEEIRLSKPELIKSQNRYGIKISAVAPSIHMIKVDAETVFEPIIGSKEQSEALIAYLLKDAAQDDMAIWNADIFGRKLSDIIQDGLHIKLSMIPEHARVRLQAILARLVNKGKGNVIAIVL
ncbi:MAG: stage IV sporulation protein A, partial [Erysipelotrichaceae bacterium]|nr:stage IV sporulation protein A [Erysipelotrichaceae bacterium]